MAEEDPRMEMAASTREMLDILTSYDTALYYACEAHDGILGKCDDAAMAAAKNLIFSVLCSKINKNLSTHGPEGLQVLPTGFDEVVAALPNPLTPIDHAAIRYALLLSRSRWGWEPWNNIKEALLEEGETRES